MLAVDKNLSSLVIDVAQYSVFVFIKEAFRMNESQSYFSWDQDGNYTSRSSSKGFYSIQRMWCQKGPWLNSGTMAVVYRKKKTLTCAVLPVCLKHIASITGADHILSFAHVELGALVIASSVVNRTVQRRCKTTEMLSFKFFLSLLTNFWGARARIFLW